MHRPWAYWAGPRFLALPQARKTPVVAGAAAFQVHSLADDIGIRQYDQ